MVFTDFKIYQVKEKIMRRKESLYAVIGGVVGAVLTIAVCSVMPLGAQNGDATFGKITCTELKVVDAGGNDGVRLTTIHPLTDPSPRGRGIVHVLGNGDGMVQLTNTNVWVVGKGGSSVLLSNDEHGGRVDVFNKQDKNRAVMAVDEYGNGAVSTWDKNGYRIASLK